MNEQLSWPRLAALLRSGAIRGYRNWLVVSAVIAGVLLIYAMATVTGHGPSSPVYRTAFFAILVLWGTIASSAAFSELHDKSKNTAYLLLPASALEKTLAPLIALTIALVAYLLVFTTVASIAIEGINWLLFRRTNDLFNPFDADVWAVVPRYLVVQAWFFLGAAWFRKSHYLKTLLAILLAAFTCLALIVLVGWIVLGTAAWGGMNVQGDPHDWLLSQWPSLGAAVLFVAPILWFVVLPVFCWYVAWLRVAETQVSHGV